MKKFLICNHLFAIFVAGIFAVPAIGAVKTSPVTMPVTLLDLYRKSDAVFEARFDKTQDVRVVREEDDYSVIRTKKLFDIYSTLKGSHQKFFTLIEDEYRYSRTQTPNYLVTSSRQPNDNGDIENTYGLRSGDPVLLFLKYGQDGKTLDLTDDEEGLKKLSAEDLAIYEKRIRELEPLLSSHDLSAASVVDWMMRCAEEPATRWEATFELVKGFERLDWQKKQQAAGNDNGRGTIATDKTDFFDSTTFAKALTVEQKRRLADILLEQKQSQFTADGVSKRTLVRGDRELIDLITHWGDPRLAGFLLDELKNQDLTDYRRSETMRLIADILGDEKVTLLANNYSNAYRDEALAAELFRDQLPVSAGDDQTPAKDAKHDYKRMRARILARFIQHAATCCSPTAL